MATKTLAELKVEAFGILTGMDPSQTPEVEDIDTIGQYVDPLFAQLAADQICLVQDQEEIPLEYFMPLARLLANVAGPRFGQAMNAEARIADENALRRLTGNKPTYETLRVVYY